MKNRRNNLRKRGLALFLVLAMCFGMLQITAFADEYEQNDDSGLDVQIVTVDHSNDTRDSDSNRSETSTEESDPAGEPSEDADAEESEPSESETNDGAVNTGDLEDYQTPETPSAPEAPAQPDQGSENDEFDLTQTDRKDQSEGVEVEIGPVTPETSANPSESDNQQTGASDENLPSQPEGDQKENSGTPDPSEPSAVTPEDKNWDVFYDKDSDTYRLTFNIKGDAQGDQTIDLTYALHLLNEYAKDIENVEKPEEPMPAVSAEEMERYNAEKAAFDDFYANEIIPFIRDFAADQAFIDSHTVEEIVAEYNYWGADIQVPQKPGGSVDKNSPEYQNYLKALEDYNRQKEANVLQPGDIRKFEIFLKSDSNHIYKYKDGSFTLATPDWTKFPDYSPDPNGNTGFDGQTLPSSPDHVDKADYHLTLRCDPIQDLLKELGVGSYEAFNGILSYQETAVKNYLEEKYHKGSYQANMEQYLLSYYSKDGVTYASIDELVHKNEDAQRELTKTITSGNKWFTIDQEEFVIDAHLEDVQYNKFYQSLFSFAYGDEADEVLKNGGDSWTDNGYEKALYYYMAHKEVWKETDEYFQQLLDKGISKESAVLSFLMAVNIDGVMTGNDWQDTLWSWHNTIELEQMDGELKLTKADTDGNTITTDEAKFQLWRIDKKVTVNDDGTETEVPVKMYCTYDKETNSYTFTNVESVLETSGGKLDVLYTLLKDTVYYLQETEAPEGYEKDPRVYVIMDEELCGKTMQECIDENNQFLTPEEAANQAYAYLGSISDEKPLEIVFVNAKVQTPPTPPTPPTPEEPDTPDGDDDDDDDDDTPSNPSEPTPEEPAYNVPEEPTPLAPAPEEEVFDEDVPLAEIPVEEEVEIPEEDVPLAEVPQTGDISAMWYVMSILSACGLASILALTGRKKEQED